MKAQDKMMYRLADALTELMQTKEFSKITVTEIARKCNLTRQIFYRYFKDKNDLIGLVYIKEFEKHICMKDTFVWEDSILRMINYLYSERIFYQPLGLADNDDMLYKILYNQALMIYRNIIEYKTKALISHELEFLLELYCRGGIDLLVNWIGTGMEIPCEELKDLFLEGMPDPIKKLLTGDPVPVKYVLGKRQLTLDKRNG